MISFVISFLLVSNIESRVLTENRANSCSWVGHCAGDPCSTYNDCDGSMICINGKCGDASNSGCNAPCAWTNHCCGDPCTTYNDCDGDLVCTNGKCGIDSSTSSGSGTCLPSGVLPGKK